VLGQDGYEALIRCFHVLSEHRGDVHATVFYAFDESNPYLLTVNYFLTWMTIIF
jgi:hypothetical protein